MTNQAWVPEAGECLVETAADYWEHCKILAKNGDYLWIEMPGQGEPETYAVNDIDLRPIPTEEDRAVEELENVLRQLPIATASFKDTARAIYKHGYRKQEAQPDMTDPANWQPTDVLVCRFGGGGLRKGDFVHFMGIEDDVIYVSRGALSSFSGPAHQFEFHHSYSD